MADGDGVGVGEAELLSEPFDSVDGADAEVDADGSTDNDARVTETAIDTVALRVKDPLDGVGVAVGDREPVDDSVTEREAEADGDAVRDSSSLKEGRVRDGDGGGVRVAGSVADRERDGLVEFVAENVSEGAREAVMDIEFRSCVGDIVVVLESVIFTVGVSTRKVDVGVVERDARDRVALDDATTEKLLCDRESVVEGPAPESDSDFVRLDVDECEADSLSLDGDFDADIDGDDDCDVLRDFACVPALFENDGPFESERVKDTCCVTVASDFEADHVADADRVGEAVL